MADNLLLQSRIITDSKETASLDLESNYEFFIPPEEIEGLDWDLINEERYEKSRNEIGEIDSIYVAVNYNDPYKDESSQFRTHLRVMDGRHKYLTSKKAGTRWSYLYVKVKDFAEFGLFRANFATGKSDKKQAMETKMIINQLCRYYYDVVGIEPKKIGRMVVKDLKNTRFSQPTIYRHLNPKFIQKEKAPHSKPKKISKKDIEISKMEKEIDSLNRQVFNLQEEINRLKNELELAQRQTLSS